MRQATVHTYAKGLFDQMGDKAEAYVAQKIVENENRPGEDDGVDWPRVRSALQVIRTTRSQTR